MTLQRIEQEVCQNLKRKGSEVERTDLVVGREVLVLQAHASSRALGDAEALLVDLARQLQMDSA